MNLRENIVQLLALHKGVLGDVLDVFRVRLLAIPNGLIVNCLGILPEVVDWICELSLVLPPVQSKLWVLKRLLGCLRRDPFADGLLGLVRESNVRHFELWLDLCSCRSILNDY